MLDRPAIELLHPAMQRGAHLLHRWGVRANSVTWTGFGLGLVAAVFIASGAYGIGLVLILVSRVCDGLDGALARLTQPTDRGAFLDVALDFIFYASIPLAFAVANPAEHALPAAALLAAFIGTGSSFLAYAVFAERRGLSSDLYPHKGIFYLGGLTEASETLICFALMCVLPAQFAVWAYGFAFLCFLTIVTRLIAGWRSFG
jgi:phosphatidylglycerophosphate synthase